MKYLAYTVLIFCFGAISCNNKEQEEESIEYVHIPPELPEHVYENIKHGDIIIRKGNGPLSFHLMAHTKEDYSHCGIIVKEDDEWKVIHTIGGTASEYGSDGVQLIDLSEFVSHAADSMLFISRPNFSDMDGDTLRNKIADRAYHYLAQEIPFDHGFSMFSTEKYYCTELLYYIFKDVYDGNVFVVEKKHKSYMLMFSTFFKKENFKPLFHLRGEEYMHSSVVVGETDGL
ncbi:MAG: hypothetical protein MK078_07385 [Crocinitomicaceae bacterium]|nr:hypothetical protein [Crocinitomicaceae bacterium]